MKGSLHTDEFMSAVVGEEKLRTARRMSHVFMIDAPRYPRPLFVTDAALNIYPTLEEKADIVQNAICLAHTLGLERPKVAILSAVETVSPKIKSTLDAAVLDDLVTRYRALAAAGLAANLYRRTATAKDARRLAGRFRSYEDLILRFSTRPDLDIFSNNEAERTIRPVKVQQRGSGGCWRTLEGLAEFALVQSYLSTAAKWGISKLDALRDLFSGNAWLPPGLEPAG